MRIPVETEISATTAMTEFNLFISEEGDMELVNQEGRLDALMSEDAVMDWLMRLEDEDAATELLDEERSRAARKAG